MNALLAQLPDFLGWHLILSLSALAIGIVLTLPLGIGAARRPKLSEWILGTASVLQTIPPLALLALMVPLLGGRIGFLPAFIALTLYSLLPILANTVTGIRGVDSNLVEAARAIGMTPSQLLWRVQLPMAIPVIITGIRTATVQVVGTATLGTPVGYTSLGNYIFQGLETRSHESIVFGCFTAAVLAIVMDQLVRLFEVAAVRRSRRLAWVGVALLLAVTAVGAWAPVREKLAASPDQVTVGSAAFTEQHILNDVIAHRLRAAGFSVEQRKGMGETIEYEALRHNSIDCYVDYSGNLWTLVMKRTDVAPRQETIDQVTRYLAEHHQVLCLGSLGFENAYALAMPRRRAEELGIKTIHDLANHSKRMKIGGDHQFFGRPEWCGLQEQYGVRFSKELAMDPSLMYTAASKGKVDVISAYTSDGRIITEDLVIIADPLQVLPPYDARLLVSPQASQRPAVVRALKSLVGRISMDHMREANKRVDLMNQSPLQAAEWLLQVLPRD